MYCASTETIAAWMHHLYNKSYPDQEIIVTQAYGDQERT